MKLFIAIPTHDGKIHTEFAQSLFSLTDILYLENLNYVIKYYKGSHINRSRNKLVEFFMLSDCTHLLFLDSDLCSYEKDIVHMVNLDKDIIGGIYSTKRFELDLIKWNMEHKINPLLATKFNLNLNSSVENAIKSLNETKTTKVKNIGTGCMLIKRHVFEKLMEVFPDRQIKGVASEKSSNCYYNFFDSFIHPEEGHYLSEDYGFCYLCNMVRITIWAYDTFPLYHIGTQMYTNRLGNYLQYIRGG